MLTIVNKKTWRKCDFPVWERVKHIVPVCIIIKIKYIKLSIEEEYDKQFILDITVTHNGLYVESLPGEGGGLLFPFSVIHAKTNLI
jgi:hypothetical protein